MAIDPKVRERNRAAQFEALGRFVEAFEDMVDEARVLCMDIISHLGAGPAPDQNLHRTMLHIVFYHQSLSAMPIFELTRAMIGQMLNDQEFRSRWGIDHEDRSVFFEILKRVNADYQELTAIRNDLLHGNWSVGTPWDEDSDDSEFFLYKPKSNKDGFVGKRDDLPQTASELLQLSKRCEDVTHWLDVICDCLPMRATLKITECFQYNGQQWACMRKPR
jgi:hypothetical protein